MMNAKEAKELSDGTAFKEGDPEFDDAMQKLEVAIRRAAENGQDHIYSPFTSNEVKEGLKKSLVRTLEGMGYTYEENFDQRDGDCSKLSWGNR